MNDNFDALKDFKPDGEDLCDFIQTAKDAVEKVPRHCANDLRQFVECFVGGIYATYNIDKWKRNKWTNEIMKSKNGENIELELNGKIEKDEFKNALREFVENMPRSKQKNKSKVWEILKILRLVKNIGNDGSHYSKKYIRSKMAMRNIRDLADFITKRRDTIYCLDGKYISPNDFKAMHQGEDKHTGGILGGISSILKGI